MSSALRVAPELTERASKPTLTEEFLRGLRSRPKTLPCKFFYDKRGSHLFDQICELDEYYLTRTESAILRDNIQEIVSCCGAECLLVEFGSGNSSKTRLLLDHLEWPIGYVPIDISRSHLSLAVKKLQEDYPGLEILPLCADYTAPLQFPAPSNFRGRTVVFFPGSTIGNFRPREARAFLERVAADCKEGDGFLIGVDLVKDQTVLERAYNDSKGITAAFNLNLLRRANHEANANFDLDQFRHRAVFNEAESRVEMQLVSTASQNVELAGHTIHFAKNEVITTEYSYKYNPEIFRELALCTGWTPVKSWTDSKRWFSVHYLELR